MPRTTKTDEGVEQSSSAGRRDARGSRATAVDTAPAHEPRAASRAANVDAPDARPDATPSREEIAQRAYEIYRERGGSDGQEMDDWVRAEQELREGRGRRQNET